MLSFSLVAEYDKCSEQGIWFTDSVSKTGLVRFLVAMEQLLLWQQTRTLLIVI